MTTDNLENDKLGQSLFTFIIHDSYMDKLSAFPSQLQTNWKFSLIFTLKLIDKLFSLFNLRLFPHQKVSYEPAMTLYLRDKYAAKINQS